MSHEPGSFRFGLRGLFLLMTGLALLLGLVIALGELVGFHGPFSLRFFLMLQIEQLPVYIVWLWGGLLLWQRRRFHPRTTKYALIGIGGLAALSIGSSLGTLWLQSPTVRRIAPSNWVFWWRVYLVFSALVNALFWVFIMKAILRFRIHPSPPAPANAQETPGTSGLPPNGLVRT